MRSVDISFYKSKAWNIVRLNVWRKQYCLCNRCHKAVYVGGLSEWIPKEKRLKGIVHHKTYLNESNVTDDNITLNEENLEGLCIECHNKEHDSTDILRDGYLFDDNGNLIKK